MNFKLSLTVLFGSVYFGRRDSFFRSWENRFAIGRTIGSCQIKLNLKKIENGGGEKRPSYSTSTKVSRVTCLRFLPCCSVSVAGVELRQCISTSFLPGNVISCINKYQWTSKTYKPKNQKYLLMLKNRMMLEFDGYTKDRYT